MRRSDFEYSLPAELIAQTPLAVRSASRLLVLDGATGRCADHSFLELPALLQPGDLLVFNDTRVLPARLAARRASGGRVELLLERPLAPRGALVQMRASNPLRAGEELSSAGGPLRLVARHGDLWEVELPEPAVEFFERFGSVPLPPYITRAADARDRERYQSLFARVPGAVAAPTASLHFDAALLAALAARGVESAVVTLHVGAGTFQPLRGEELEEHVMHSERYAVPTATVDAISRTRSAGGRVLAVGTTVARSLESAAVFLAPRGQRRDRAVHPAGVQVSSGRRTADQLSPAGLDPADAGGGVRRARADARRLPARGAAALPVLQLW